MYVKVYKTKNKNGSLREYLQIVETKRTSDKPYPQQRLLLNVARLDGMDEKTRKMLTKLAYGIIKAVGGEVPEDMDEDDIKKTGEKYWWGLFALVERIWQELSLDKVSLPISKQMRIQYPLDKVLLAIVAARLYGKVSELSVSRWIEKVYDGFEIHGVQLHHLYRGLEVLSRNWMEFEENLRWKVLDLFHLDARLIFLDTTSLTYWGDGDGDYTRRGYSKQKRGDKNQLIIGIVLVDGLPIGIEIQPGNTADVDTVREMIARFSKRFDLREVCIVSDAGMVSLDDIRDYHERGWQYLLKASNRENEVKRAVREARDDINGWEELDKNLLARRFRVRLPDKEKERGEYLIVVLNKEQESYDREVRENVVNQLQRLEGKNVKKLVNNRSYRRYLVAEGTIKVDEEKVRSAALWDGIWVLRTNRDFSNLGEAIERYKELWRVERAFRDLKNLWEISPVYHWNAERIKGHIYTCFLSFIIGSLIQKQIMEQQVKLPYDEVIEGLKELRLEWIQVRSKRFLLRDELNGWQKKLFEDFKVKIPAGVVEMA